MTTNEEMEDLYGPAATHSEYAIGATIRYRRNGSEMVSGTIIWVVAPLSYVVETQEGGMPDVIYQSDIVE